MRSAWLRFFLYIAVSGLTALSNTASAETVSVAIVSRTVFYVPLWVAHKKGFFKDEGLDTSIKVFDNAEKINEELHNGTMQIAISTPESIIVDSYNGGTLKVIAGNAKKLPHFIITKPEIKSLQELRHANIGVLSLNEGTTYLVRTVAKSAGLSPDDYTISAVGGAPTRWKLLKDRKIDAGLQPFPLSYEAEAAGFNNLGPVSAYIPDWQFTSVNVNDSWATQHRSTIVSFLRALRRGQDYVTIHPDEAAHIAAKELNVEFDLAKRALADVENLGILDKSLNLSEPGLRTVFNSLQDTKVIAMEKEYDAAKFVDSSYLKESQ